MDKSIRSKSTKGNAADPAVRLQAIIGEVKPRYEPLPTEVETVRVAGARRLHRLAAEIEALAKELDVAAPGPRTEFYAGMPPRPGADRVQDLARVADNVDHVMHNEWSRERVARMRIIEILDDMRAWLSSAPSGEINGWQSEPASVARSIRTFAGGARFDVSEYVARLSDDDLFASFKRWPPKPGRQRQSAREPLVWDLLGSMMTKAELGAVKDLASEWRDWRALKRRDD